MSAWHQAVAASLVVTSGVPGPAHDRSFWSGIAKNRFTGSDTLFLRAFSALDLSLLAALDNSTRSSTTPSTPPCSRPPSPSRAGEKDLRAFDPRRGWMHATAHTADLLEFLARSPRLRPSDDRPVN